MALVAHDQALPKDVPFLLEFIQAVLDDVTDAHDPTELAAVDHG